MTSAPRDEYSTSPPRAQPPNGRIIPNSFQTPNFYVDVLLPLLTSEESKVLLYAVRRTFGFLKRSDRISISQFCEGITTDDGRQLDRGTGLGQQAVITALRGLRQFGIMRVIAEGNPARHIAPEYELELDDTRIDVAGLEARDAERRSAGKKRTATATTTRAERGTSDVERSERGTSDVGRGVRRTKGETANRGTSDVETKASRETQLETQDSPASRKRNTGARQPRQKKEPQSPLAIRQALADACGIDLAVMTREQALQVNQSGAIIWKAATKKGTPEADVVKAISDVAKWCRKHAWECKKGEAPTPAILRSYWRQAIDARAAAQARYQPPAPQVQPQAPEAAPAPVQKKPASLGYERAKIDERIYHQRKARGEAVPPLDECNWQQLQGAA